MITNAQKLQLELLKLLGIDWQGKYISMVQIELRPHTWPTAKIYYSDSDSEKIECQPLRQCNECFYRVHRGGPRCGNPNPDLNMKSCEEVNPLNSCESFSCESLL